MNKMQQLFCCVPDVKLISFDACRTLSFGNTHYLKAEQMNNHIQHIMDADGVLFPQYWQVNSLIYGLKKRIFPSVASYHIGHDKVEMTRCFTAVAPANVPWTIIDANTPYAAEQAWDAMPLPFVAKIPKSSMGEGVFLIENRQDWRKYLEKTPVIYVQEYLPIDRDLRIIWAGDCIVGGYWRLQAEQGFYNNLARGGSAETGILPPEACELVTRLATELGINHGGFDIAMVDRHPYVFEFNRIFGNQGVPGIQQKVDQAITEYLLREWGFSEPENPDSPESGPVSPFPGTQAPFAV